MSTEADKLRAAKALIGFAREIIRDIAFEGGCCGDVIQEAAEKYGLVRCEPFDPAKHEGSYATMATAGDPWFVFTDILDDKAIELAEASQ